MKIQINSKHETMPKAHSKINRKMEYSTPGKIVTPENFSVKLGTRDYVENIAY